MGILAYGFVVMINAWNPKDPTPFGTGSSCCTVALHPVALAYFILFKSMIVFTTVSGFRLIESMPSVTRKRAKSR